MPRTHLTPAELQELHDLAVPWGKIIARRTGDDAIDFDLSALESIAQAAGRSAGLLGVATSRRGSTGGQGGRVSGNRWSAGARSCVRWGRGASLAAAPGWGQRAGSGGGWSRRGGRSRRSQGWSRRPTRRSGRCVAWCGGGREARRPPGRRGAGLWRRS